MHIAIGDRWSRAGEVIAEIEEVGRRRPLAAAAGGFAAGAVGALLLRLAGRSTAGDGATAAKRPPVGGTRASSYGRDNPSGPGYNWPPEPAPAG
ncbi:MAG TPA: hypothetical protein VKA89_06915 [Solirubrobacterales bacterium]|nr:hypothetical protein [Solirubrobacterales bacterium]